MSLSKVLEVARGELGQHEDPAGSNLTKYGFWYGVDGVPWCVIFLCWVFSQAGERMAFFVGGKTASCSTLLRWYKEQGLTVPVSEVQPGDIVILNFHGTKDTEHCGLVYEVVCDTFGHLVGVRTYEGNTSPSDGSQSNGGMVCDKDRLKSQIVGVCRPQYKEDDPQPVDDVTGHFAETEIRWAEDNGIVKGFPDGSFKPNQGATRAEICVILYRLFKLIVKLIHGEDDLK